MIGGTDVVGVADGMSVRCGDKAVSSGESRQGGEVSQGSGKELHTVAGRCNPSVHEGIETVSAAGIHAGIFDSARHQLVKAVPEAVYGLALVADSCVG